MIPITFDEDLEHLPPNKKVILITQNKDSHVHQLKLKNLPHPATVLRVGHVNINRLTMHFNELEAHCATHAYDLQAITETWLDDRI